MTTRNNNNQWLFFADAVAAIDAEQIQISRGDTTRALRYLWANRQRLDCAHCFRRLGGRLLVDVQALREWRDGAEVRHGD